MLGHVRAHPRQVEHLSALAAHHRRVVQTAAAAAARGRRVVHHRVGLGDLRQMRARRARLLAAPPAALARLRRLLAQPLRRRRPRRVLRVLRQPRLQLGDQSAQPLHPARQHLDLTARGRKPTPQGGELGGLPLGDRTQAGVGGPQPLDLARLGAHRRSCHTSHRSNCSQQSNPNPATSTRPATRPRTPLTPPTGDHPARTTREQLPSGERRKLHCRSRTETLIR